MKKFGHHLHNTLKLLSRNKMENTLTSALRRKITQELQKENMAVGDISNYVMSRTAITGVFNILIYRKGKTKKGDKRGVSIPLDTSTSTFVAAIDTLDAMIKEESNRSFLAKNTSDKELKMGY